MSCPISGANFLCRSNWQRVLGHSDISGNFKADVGRDFLDEVLEVAHIKRFELVNFRGWFRKDMLVRGDFRPSGFKMGFRKPCVRLRHSPYLPDNLYLRHHLKKTLFR